MEQITDNVYVESGFLGCVVSFVTTKDGIVMIDTPMMPEDTLGWKDEISNKGEVRYLISTEHHPDHITGNHFFEGIVISSEETRKEILLMKTEQLIERVRSIDPATESLFEEHNYTLKIPNITFSNEARLYIGDHIIELYLMPGHTLGQTVVHIPKERTVIAGDNVFHNEQFWMHDCDPFQWLMALDKIAEMDVDVIVPGHGKVCDKGYIPETSSFIQEWIDAVKEAIGEGLSKEEAMEKISFLDRYPMPAGIESWGPDLQKWNVARLYDLMIREA